MPRGPALLLFSPFYQGGKVLAGGSCSHHFLFHLIGHNRSCAYPVPTVTKGNRIPRPVKSTSPRLASCHKNQVPLAQKRGLATHRVCHPWFLNLGFI